MTKPLSVAIALCLLTLQGVAQTPATGPLRAEWDSVASHLPPGLKAAAALESFRLRHGLFFTLWADSTVDPTRYPLDDGPCGSVASTFAATLPLTTHPLSVELALEVDSSGHVLRRWPIPLDTRIDGIDGDVLLVPYQVWTGTESTVAGELAIRPSGSFQVLPVPTVPTAPDIGCPPIAIFAASAYTTCQRFLDRTTKKRRLIAYQIPCT